MRIASVDRISLFLGAAIGGLLRSGAACRTSCPSKFIQSDHWTRVSAAVNRQDELDNIAHGTAGGSVPLLGVGLCGAASSLPLCWTSWSAPFKRSCFDSHSFNAHTSLSHWLTHSALGDHKKGANLFKVSYSSSTHPQTTTNNH